MVNTELFSLITGNKSKMSLTMAIIQRSPGSSSQLGKTRREYKRHIDRKAKHKTNSI